MDLSCQLLASFFHDSFLLYGDWLMLCAENFCSDTFFPAQIEGGFVMGIGNVTTEELVYDEKGRLLNDGTWEYKPPCSKTIPQVTRHKQLSTNDQLGLTCLHDIWNTIV